MGKHICVLTACYAVICLEEEASSLRTLWNHTTAAIRPSCLPQLRLGADWRSTSELKWSDSDAPRYLSRWDPAMLRSPSQHPADRHLPHVWR